MYSKSNNAKELVRSKYGASSKIENQVKQEIWIYNYSSSIKSNRTVIFDKNGKVLTVGNMSENELFLRQTGWSITR